MRHPSGPTGLAGRPLDLAYELWRWTSAIRTPMLSLATDGWRKLWHMTVIDADDCIWLFDSDAMRFRSTVKGLDTTSPWWPYHRLIVRGPGCFVVVLDRAGTRRLRVTGAEAVPGPERSPPDERSDCD